MVAGNVFKVSIDLKRRYSQFYLYYRKYFKRQGPDERVRVVEDVRRAK